MTFKLAIAMPVDGTPETARVCYAVQIAKGRILQTPSIVTQMVPEFKASEIPSCADVVRARDRLARVFLHDTDCDGCLWWDEDVLPDDLQVIGRMITSGHDVIGAPYRRKKDPEEYPYHPLDCDVEVTRGCVEVGRLAFGFMYTSRRALRAMWDHYKADRWYYDVAPDRDGGRSHYETVSMFGLQWTSVVPGPDGAPWRTLLSEDYSFCESYRAMGQLPGGTPAKVQMFVGDGSPVAHIGSKAFRGTREGLVRFR